MRRAAAWRHPSTDRHHIRAGMVPLGRGGAAGRLPDAARCSHLTLHDRSTGRGHERRSGYALIAEAPAQVQPELRIALLAGGQPV